MGVARDDGKEKGEYSTPGFRRDRFTLVESGTFWLSPTPALPSKGWDAALPRIATWARLRDRAAKRILLVVNTHFDHIGEVARQESARLIRHWIDGQRKAGESAVLMGDFNSPATSNAYAAIVEPGKGALKDSRIISRTPHYGPLGTFTGFKIAQMEPSPIDHIFVSDDVTILRHATLTDQNGGKLPSDHYPVLADLCIGKGC